MPLMSPRLGPGRRPLPPPPLRRPNLPAMGKNEHHQPPSSQPSTSTRKRKRRETRDIDPNSGSGSDCSTTSSPASVRRLLEPYARPRLLALLAGAAAADPALLARLRAAADASPSHRRVFVRGLPPHAGGADLESAFSRFGPLAGCHAVADRASGRCKGYGFVTFSSRAAARRAVLGPRGGGVAIAGRPVSAQYATGGGGSGAGRRVYVTNVAPDADAEALRAFFARLGELEGGPFGFDADTGRSRGYALFVYRAADGARKALEEPYRVFEGRTLHCQLASSPARKSNARLPPPPSPAAASAAMASPPAATSALQPIVDAVVASGVGRNLAAYAKNPAQAAAFLGRNPIIAAAVLSSALASVGALLTPSASAAAAPRNPAAVIVPSQAASPAQKPSDAAAARSPVTAAAAAPSPAAKICGPSGGAGLLGAYKPPPSPSVASSLGRKGTLLGT